MKFCLCLILTSFTLFSLAGEEGKRVLFISSYHPGFSTFFQQVDGLKDKLDPAGVGLEVEFMDTKRFPEEENWEHFTHTLSYKLANSDPFDLVITADDNALLFALREKDRLLSGLPVIFLGVNNVYRALEMNGEPNITGVIEQISGRETIELMISQNPEARNIVILVDGTPSGQGDLKTVWSQKENFPGLNFINIDLQKLSWGDFAAELNELEGDSSVLLLSAYFDSGGTAKSFDQSLDLILSNLSLPLYHLWYHGLGDGILGGHVISHYEQASSAADMALSVLNGKDISAMEVLEKSPNRYMFDHEVMERYQINKRTIPEDSLILNEPYSFYREFTREIWTVSVSFVLLFTGFFILFFNRFKRMEAESSLSQLQKAVRQIEDTIEIYDRDHKLIYANEAFLKAHGFTLGRIVGKSPDEIFKGTSRENLEKDENLWKTVESGVPWRGQFSNEAPDGRTIIQDVTLSPYYSDKGHIDGFISIKKDISELVGLMEERNTIQEHLFRAQKLESVGQLANGIAHDFNNILSGIMSASQLLLMPERQIDDKAKKYGNMIYQSCDRGAELVTKLMNFSQSNRSSIVETEIKDLVDETVEILEHTIKKNISFSVDDQFAHGILNCEASSIQNALLNLGINSCHAIKDRGWVNFRLAERTLDRDYCYRSPYTLSPGRFCSISVSDNGSGITEENSEKIFEAFFTTKGKHEGTGLGLSSVKRIVEEHRGAIELKSAPGRGTTFELLIPLDLEALVL